MTKPKLILILCILILLSSLVSATNTIFCYQESANDSTQFAQDFAIGPPNEPNNISNGNCNQVFNGTYSFTSGFVNSGVAIDGNWTQQASGAGENMSINYTKPPKAFNAIWFTKASAGQFVRNTTIPDICFDAYPDKIRLEARLSSAAALNAFCWNTTDFLSIGQIGNSNTIVEEAIWWNVTVGIDDCTLYNITVLRITGKDEETNEDVNTTLNIFLEPIFSTGTSNSYELSGKTNYTFCADKNYSINAIMEYGDGTIYTDRKYYLNNFSIDISTISNVFLYHLNNTKASEIVFTVFDTTTGDRVKDVFIKILRYYPGENLFRIVEIAKTDEVGQSLGKMILADVFYKFIIESPAGTVKLDTGVLRILSLTRSFGISFVEDVLAVWDKIHGVSYLTTCTKGTKTCRVTWIDSSNIVQSVTLEVWRVTGLADTLLSSQTTTASAGTISYTVVEDTATNTYEARAFARSTNPSDWSFGRARFFDSDNPFFTDPANRLASLFPLFLLMVVITFALIDWGVVGIVIGSLLGMVVGSITGILPISPFYLISFILMAVILIYKLSK
ncbi:hypothetical protein LCGC14_2183680 [marine sediment metagenome]|uniref:Uncharacterized protein n=1 Tax=marine sediment metagenome TaxID=412755 RepID=A0A0F9E8L1_9ZZZZ